MSGHWLQKNTEIDPDLPPTSFTVLAKLATNKTDVVLTWIKAIDPNGDPVTYSVVYKDTLVQHLTDTTYTLKNIDYNTVVVGKIIAFDSHNASTLASFSITTGTKPLARLRLLKTEGTGSNYTYWL